MTFLPRHNTNTKTNQQSTAYLLPLPCPSESPRCVIVALIPLIQVKCIFVMSSNNKKPPNPTGSSSHLGGPPVTATATPYNLATSTSMSLPLQLQYFPPMTQQQVCYPPQHHQQLLTAPHMLYQPHLLLQQQQNHHHHYLSSSNPQHAPPYFPSGKE
jgi:hypothetical protein